MIEPLRLAEGDTILVLSCRSTCFEGTFYLIHITIYFCFVFSQTLTGFPLEGDFISY